VKDLKSEPPADGDAKGNGESANRRRVGRVVHDDRGWASVEWQDAPENYVRPVLELETGATTQTRLKSVRSNAPLSNSKKDAFNPYQRAAAEVPAGGGTRRDLRKLSKWIKMMREIEERKVLDKEEAEKPREE
jgi:hypothetical protein